MSFPGIEEVEAIEDKSTEDMFKAIDSEEVSIRPTDHKWKLSSFEETVIKFNVKSSNVGDILVFAYAETEFEGTRRAH